MDGIAWTLSAMSAARMRLDVAAENLANASSDGFRKCTLRGVLTASGVRLARRTADEEGPLRPTGRDFDLAIVGKGSFAVRDAAGRIHHTRDGAFARDRFGHLLDREGRMLIGSRGVLVAPADAKFDASGAVLADGRVLDRLPLPRGSAVRSGFLESANVDAIGEMIDVLTAQRSFETAEKVLAAIDQTRERASTQVALVKA